MPVLKIESLVLHEQINLSIAVDLGSSKGLLAPVIHGADRLSVPELASQIKGFGRPGTQSTAKPG